MKTVAVIQARMGSSRLPGKVLAEISGVPMLMHVVRRVREAATVDEVILATTTSTADDAVADFCRREKITCHRGSEDDVLDRFYQAAQNTGAEVVVRITGDCPLIDPEVIDRVVRVAQDGDCDYAANVIRYTYPDGLDVEAFSFAALQRAWNEAAKSSQREHVTTFLRTEDGIRRHNVEHDLDLSSRHYRWTVDTAADLEFVRAVYRAFEPRTNFRLGDILDLLDRQPALTAMQANEMMNEGYYQSILGEARAGAAPKLRLDQSFALLERTRKVIPGCAQTFSKGSTQYVAGVAPVFLQRGKGCRVWDVDGNEYIDYVQGLLPNILGYAHDEVNAGARGTARRRPQLLAPAPARGRTGRAVVRGCIPCAEMVRFGKERLRRDGRGGAGGPGLHRPRARSRAAATTAGRIGSSAARLATRACRKRCAS